MSIPQICPSCENHISAAHAPWCCYGTAEYAHLGWPSFTTGITRVASTEDGVSITNIAHPTHMHPVTMEEMSKDGFVDSASAIRRLLAYLQDEPEETVAQPVSDMTRAISRLASRAEELRKEAAGLYNIEGRAKRNFAADVLTNLISELTE